MVNETQDNMQKQNKNTSNLKNKIAGWIVISTLEKQYQLEEYEANTIKEYMQHKRN